MTGERNEKRGSSYRVRGRHLAFVLLVAAVVLGSAARARSGEAVQELATVPSQAGKTGIPDVRLPMAIQQSATLVDDMVIRITNAGFDFLARQVQWLMSGWVRRDRVSLDAPNTVMTMLADMTMGLKSYFDAVIADACLYLGNTNDDDGDGSSCDCGIRYGLDPPGDWNARDCTNCWPGNAGNPTPSGPWGTNPSVSGCANSGPGWKLAYFPDPSNPDDPTWYYWCKGPFYDSPVVYNNARIDPDCLKRDPADNSYCPNVGTGQGCDNVCDTANDAANDVRVVLTNNTAQERLDIYIELEYVKVDGFLWYSVPCDCCFLEKRNGTTGGYGTYEGSLINPNYADINGWLRFVDGYGTMLGRDGEPYTGSTSGGGSTSGSTGGGSTSGGSSGSKGTCNPPSSSGGSSGGSGGGSTGGGGGPASLNNDPLVGVVLEVPEGSGVNLQNSLELDHGYSGPCFDQGWLCDAGCAIAGGLLDLIDSFLTGLIEDAVRNLLADNIQPLIEEELGLPLDFPMLIAGQGSGLAKDVCALRMPNPLDHILGFSCSHASNNCPCDDADADGWLNYQDPSPGVTPTGCPAGTWCGAWNDSGEMYYSWYYGLGNSIGGYNGSEPPFFETGAYVDDRWDTNGVNLVVDPTIVPYKSGNTRSLLSGNWRQGYYPDPDAANGLGVWWTNPTDGFPARSCYPSTNLLLDATDRDNNLGTRVDAPGVGDPNNAGSPLSQAEFDALLNDWDSVAPGGIHYMFMFSQQFIQEFLYDLYASGMLCIDVNRQQFDFLADILQVSNFKMFVPMLGDAVAGNYVWDQNGYVEIRFIPRDIPIVRVLGTRTGCFPNGDQIAPDNVYFAHEGLDEHTPVSSCGSPGAPNAKNTYDLLIYFPHMYIEVNAPRASDGQMLTLFNMDWDIGLAVAVEYSFGLPNGGSGTTWPGNLPRFFEILVDGFLGCGGSLFDASGGSQGNWGGLNLPVYGSPTCGIISGDIPLSQVQGGISGFLHGIINSVFSAVLQTKIFLGGLNVDFYKIGYANPAAISSLRLDSDPVGDYGRGTPDYLVLAGRFLGTLDFAGLFSLMGGISLAPQAPGTPVGVETYLGLAVEDDTGLRPLRQTNGRVELSPAESHYAGFSTAGGYLSLAADVFGFADETEARESIEYSWRLDGGLWHPYLPGDTLRLPPLASGRHTVEVRARVGSLLVDEEPARLTFWVDGVPPDLFVRDADGAVLDPAPGETLYVEGLQLFARDNISQEEFVHLEYKVDAEPWREAIAGYVPVEEWTPGVPHRVQLRATDEFGNSRELSLTVVPSGAGPAGCGCSVAGEGGPAPWFVGLLLVLAARMLMGVRRERRRVWG